MTVWCVWWRDPSNPDKYSEYYVTRLRRSVRENLSIPHRFVCITDQTIRDVETMPFPVEWPAWWIKLSLFKPGIPAVQNLYLDLDVVITGSLDEMVEQYADEVLAMPLNWAQSGHGGCQSSVMLWRQSKYTLPIYQRFNPKDARWPPVNDGYLWGDQEWITKLRDEGVIEVTPIRESWIKSYKYHCQNGLPDDCRITVWHGEPKPADVRESWFAW